MAELARGSVADRPWGRTLGTLGLRYFTGTLALAADGKRYQIAFSDGAVVAAMSPLASDAAVRVALTGGLITSTQVAEMVRRPSSATGRDEIELLTELLRLTPEQSMRLRRRTIAQKAARTFSIDRGEFVLDDQISLAVLSGSEIDVRSVIYLGARQNLSEARLASDLAQFGLWFRLLPSAIEDLPQFGFTEADRLVLERLHLGATLDELETGSVEPRTARAMVYALVSCNACEIGGPGRGIDPAVAARVMRAVRSPEPATAVRAAGTIPLSRPQTSASSAPGAAAPAPGAAAPAPGAAASAPGAAASAPGAAAPAPGAAAAAPGAAASAPGAAAPAPAPTPAPAASGGVTRFPTPPPAPMSRRSPPALATPASGEHRIPVRIAMRRADPARAGEVRALIAERLLMLDQGVDHYQLLGVAVDASFDAVRDAYFALARQLHPDRLAALGIDDGGRDAQRLFAQVNTAFAILSDRARRDAYTAVLRRGGEAVLAAEQAQAEAMARRIIDSEEAFQRGEAALRAGQLPLAISELGRAVELHPGEADYRASLAWAQFCAAPDKPRVGSETRAALEQAIAASPNAINPRFLLGRVERILGKDADALRHFQEVLRRSPGHHEAASEARLIEQRLAQPPRRR
ncbi:MAG TPA: DnaJ domain-containing protein [Kofleriaceae bacterium]|nr:DnaJ domain-containing protein [Kofleriaceae bacterium]